MEDISRVLGRYEKALSKYLVGKFRMHPTRLLVDDETILYQWMRYPKPRGSMIKPKYMLEVTYVPSLDLFDVTQRLVNGQGEVEKEVRSTGVYIEAVIDPSAMLPVLLED